MERLGNRSILQKKRMEIRMVQLIITQAENGFVVETKGNGVMEINIAANLAQVVKAVKGAFNQAETQEEAPF